MTRQHSNASSSIHIRFAWSNANHHVILHSASLHSGATPVGEYEYHDYLLMVPQQQTVFFPTASIFCEMFALRW